MPASERNRCRSTPQGTYYVVRGRAAVADKGTYTLDVDADVLTALDGPSHVELGIGTTDYAVIPIVDCPGRFTDPNCRFFFRRLGRT